MQVRLSDEVVRALTGGRPVVVLESSVLAHGLPCPRNLEAHRRTEAAVRAEGAVPATVAVLDGFLRVGLGTGEVARLAQGGVARVGCGDLSAVMARGGDGATTVSATLAAARAASPRLRVMATGGIGGVHRGGQTTLDVSADLHELARTPVAVICSGAKVVLDLPRTLEVLETLGVPVIGYGTDRFPAFYAGDSGLPLAHRAETPLEVARLLHAHWTTLRRTGGVLIAQPPPDPLDPEITEEAVARAVAEAEARGVTGKALTPFLLRRLEVLTAGRSLEGNLALLEANARIAARVAVELARHTFQEAS